ncbi:hypothetical protein AAVH_26745 [Aphelenchoides avenae]|nr:hypothetical protein AAVH_26745 [Aphelenchus avenae]
MGHGHLARKTLKHLRRKCPDFVIRPCLVDRVKSQKDRPIYPIEFLDGYDPEFTDFLGEGPQDAISSYQRRAIDDVVLFEEALRLVEDGKYEQALEHLEKLLESLRLPYSLTLRATCYVEAANGQSEVKNKLICLVYKAYTDVCEALNMDKHFHDAIHLKGRILSSLGLYSHARRQLKTCLTYVAESSEPAHLLRSIADKDDHPTLPSNLLESIDLSDDGGKNEDADDVTRKAEEIVGNIERYVNKIEHHFGHHILNTTTCKVRNTAKGTLMDRLSSALAKASKQWDEWEEKCHYAEIAMRAAKDRLLTREMEMKELQSELKLLEKLLKTELPPVTVEDYARLHRTLHEKESALHYLQHAYDSVHAQNHDYKEELQRQKQKRMSAKTQLKASEAVEAQIAELKAERGRIMETIADLTHNLQRLDAEIIVYKRKEMDQKALHDKDVGAPSSATDGNTSHIGIVSEKLIPDSNHERLIAFKDAVYATLFSRVEGHMDMKSILDDLRESEDIDGEMRAREHGYDSLEAFLRSLTMKDRVIVVDSLGGTVYKARPNADTQHIHDAQLEGAQYAAERRIRSAVNNATNRMRDALKDERDRATSLAEELNELRDELRRQQREAGELEAQVRCQLCMDRVNRTSFVCADEGREFFCGHLDNYTLEKSDILPKGSEN